MKKYKITNTNPISKGKPQRMKRGFHVGNYPGKGRVKKTSAKKYR